MLKIRLRRVGARKQPSYRIVIAESTAPRDGRFVEVIGFYNPRTEPETVRLQEDRALYWLSVGAQPTESVARILRTRGTQNRFERMKAGESLEALVAEAEAAEQEISPKTKPAVRKSGGDAAQPEAAKPEAKSEKEAEEEAPAEDAEA